MGDETYNKLAEELLRSNYGDDPREAFRNPLLQYSKETFRPDTLPALPPLPSPAPHRVWERYHRPGDPLNPGTQPEMEALAGEFGHELGQGNWGPAALAAAGLGTGLAQGRNRASGLPGKPKAPKPEPAPRELDPLGFYSQALEVAKNLHRKQGSAASWVNELKRFGVKDAEMQAMRLNEFLAANPTPTKDQILQHLRDNRVQVRETIYGGEKKEPEWGMRPRVLSDGQKTKDWEVYNLKTGERQGLPQGHFGDKSYVEQAVKTMNSNPDIRWKRASGQNLLLDPENPTNRESVVHLPLTHKMLEMGKARGYGEHHGYSANPNGDAMWEGRTPVSGVTDTPFKIGEESGHITYWPQTFRHLNGDMNTPGGPKYIVNSPNMQNARFPSLNEAKAAIEKSYNVQGEGNSGMVYNRPDVYREPHFSRVPNYLFHLRAGQYKDAQGRPVLLGDEFQSTRAQKIRDTGGARDEDKIAELEKRYQEATDKHGAAFDAATQWLYDNGWPPMAGGRDPSRMEIHKELERQGAKKHMEAISRAAEDMKLLSAEHLAAQNSVPGHPLVNDMGQTNLTGLRRLLQQGVDSGVEGIALTPGDLQNQRYNLSKFVHGLAYDPRGQFLYYRPSGSTVWNSATGSREIPPTDVHTFVGKEMADKLLAAPKRPTEPGTGFGGAKEVHALDNLKNVEIGGQGMRDYYDRQYPETLAKELKRLDPQWPGMEQTRLMKRESPEEAQARSEAPWASERSPYPTPFHYFPLTPKIKEEVAKGLPLFGSAGLAAALLQEHYGSDDSQ